MAKKKKKRKSKKHNSKKPRSPIFALLSVIVSVVAGLVLFVVVTTHDFADVATWTVRIFNTIAEFVGADTYIPLPGQGEAIVHFIDVGQGDAVLIHTAEGSVLIDGGDNHMGERVVSYLRRLGIREITYVVATHPHSDHIGGLIDVLYAFPVGTLIMPPIAHTTLTFEHFLDAIESNNITLQEPIAGSSFGIGGATFTVIAPNSSGYSNINDYSVSLRMTFGVTSFIFTGDAEAASEAEMVEAGHVLSSNVLHLGHHGSTTSTTQPFLNAVNPEIAVISVGASNGHGHPHRAVINRLNAAGTRIYRTDRHGNVVVSTNGADLTVLTVRGTRR